jgi:hypothetical protein
VVSEENKSGHYKHLELWKTVLEVTFYTPPLSSTPTHKALVTDNKNFSLFQKLTTNKFPLIGLILLLQLHAQ